ncbi:unnamed protein product [Cylindrotheca closterium]|uniref:Uncharacterized protein n=1 Tax=Cylindrotheca closterium TaxID=2856 RepID=A0AAD2G8U1_9STRA|nr:unnamed protein product [Cylindrotheca closterium]
MTRATEYPQTKGYSRNTICTALLAAIAVLKIPENAKVTAFQQINVVTPFQTRQSIITQRFSSVGDGAIPPEDPEEGGGGDLDGFLNPKKESDNLKKAREFMSESSLPLSYDEDDETNDEADGIDKVPLDHKSSALVGAFGSSSSSSLFADEASMDAQLAKNPYMQVVSKLSPSEIISKFTATANPRVQEAVRSTILGLIGSLPKMAFETTTITTGQRLASLMFQLQMTGYMFKNAEYRLSLSQSLGINPIDTTHMLSGDPTVQLEDIQEKIMSGKIKGKLKVRMGKKPESDKALPSTDTINDPNEIEVDAAAYMSELRSEVSKLKEELKEHEDAKEEELRKDLLLYIRTLPAQELKELTNTMSQDVLVCMKGLVQAVLAGIGDGKIAPDTVTEQSGEAMAQLCMWQLAVGYNLRELEVREELKNKLTGGMGNASDDENGIDFSQPGILE